MIGSLNVGPLLPMNVLSKIKRADEREREGNSSGGGGGGGERAFIIG